MTTIKKFEDLEDLLINLRGQHVLLDADIARIYGVETRDINKAVANNPAKFPEGYIIELTLQDKKELVEKFHRFNSLKHSTATPKAFPEKGLYMLAITCPVKCVAPRRGFNRGFEKPAGCSGNPGHHRDICQDPRAFPDHQNTFHKSGQG